MPGKSLVKNPNKDDQFYAQIALPSDDLPSDVTMSDLRESPVRTFPVSVVDLVTASKAKYDSAAKTLHVEAESSDEGSSQMGSRPKLSVQGSDSADFGLMTFANGKYTLDKPAVSVPPQKVVVRSDKGGWDELAVETTASAITAFNLVTEDDSVINSSAPMNVLLNDSLNGAVINPAQVKVWIARDPEHGTVIVNPDKTVSYTQRDAVNGNDSFTYYLTDLSGDIISNVSTVNFTLNSGNLPPVANPDTASAGAGATITIDVLANDTDPEGQQPTLVSVTGAGASAVGGKVQYVAPAQVGTPNVAIHDL